MATATGFIYIVWDFIHALKNISRSVLLFILIYAEFSFECLITFSEKFLSKIPQVNRHYQDKSLIEVVKIYRKYTSLQNCQ